MGLEGGLPIICLFWNVSKQYIFHRNWFLMGSSSIRSSSGHMWNKKREENNHSTMQRKKIVLYFHIETKISNSLFQENSYTLGLLSWLEKGRRVELCQNSQSSFLCSGGKASVIPRPPGAGSEPQTEASFEPNRKAEREPREFNRSQNKSKQNCVWLDLEARTKGKKGG